MFLHFFILTQFFLSPAGGTVTVTVQQEVPQLDLQLCILLYFLL